MSLAPTVDLARFRCNNLRNMHVDEARTWNTIEQSQKSLYHSPSTEKRYSLFQCSSLMVFDQRTVIIVSTGPDFNLLRHARREFFVPKYFLSRLIFITYLNNNYLSTLKYNPGKANNKFTACQ